MKSLKITPQITRRETESFVKYLQEVNKIGKTYKLTKEEEVCLAQKIKNGDKKAEDELVKSNLKFVISVAKQYQSEGVELGDLVNEGNIGLINAARKFDSDKNIKFISYAVWWVRQSILCYLNQDARFIRLPLNKISQLNKIRKIEEKFEQKHRRKPSNTEIIEILELEMDSKSLSDLFMLNKRTQSLDVTPSSNDVKSDNFTLKDLLVDVGSFESEELSNKDDLKIITNNLLKKVSPIQKQILEMYYGLTGQEPKTLDEIGAHFNLTRERIRQLKNTSIRRLSNKRNKTTILNHID